MRLFGRKSAGRAVARPALARAFPWTVGAIPRSYEAQLRTGFLDNAIAQRAVRLVAEGVGGAPLAASDPKLLALVTAPSAGQSLLETLAAHVLLHGNGFVQILEGADGAPRELYALRPERVAIEGDARGWPIAFNYRASDSVTRIPADSLIHVKAMHPLDDHYGLGCLGGASGAIAIHNAATLWNKALLDNAARPSGALVYEAGEALSSDQFERLQEELKASFGGAENAGRPMLLEGGLRWQALSLSPADMDFIALKAAAARDIALAFGVPPMLLGLPGDATYANYREANRALWRQTILPLAGKLLSAIAQGLGRTFPGASLSVDLDRVTELSEDRERLWAQVNTAGFLTLDEKREAVGLGALAIGDDVGDAPPDGEADEAPDVDPEGEDDSLEIKFNPYHDPRNGQFTFAPGGVGRGQSFDVSLRPDQRSPGIPGSNSGASRKKPDRFNIGTAKLGEEQSDRSSDTLGQKPPAAVRGDVALDTSDDNRIGAATVGSASNILTNETNGLSGGKPGELEAAKVALAHAIQNGLLLPKPPQVAPTGLSAEASRSIGRADDQRIMRGVFVQKMLQQDDPVKGAIYYGTSPSLITSRRIGRGRQDVLLRFGPFDHGKGVRQYVYIYGEPYFPVRK